MQLFLHSNTRENTKGLVQEAVEGLEVFWNESKTYFETIVSQTVKDDVVKSNAIKNLEAGTFPALEAEAAQNEEAIDTPPIARTGHYAFALLDLKQQAIKPGCLKWVDESIQLAMYVAKTAVNSFLRRKALETLLSVGKMEGVGLINIERELSYATENRKLAGDWKEVKIESERRANFRGQLSSIVADSRNVQPVDLL